MADDRPINAATATADERPADRTLIIERVFKAGPETVFKAWTDPAILVKWWGPEGFETPECKMDVRAGGAWRTTMVSPKGDSHTVSGVYREISPPRRLVMTWGWEQDSNRGHETVIEVTFEPTGTGTKMRLVQSVFESQNARDMHSEGWNSTFNDLERFLAS
jgi:uncharacterized protein YndB with AHSA1/START domain